MRNEGSNNGELTFSGGETETVAAPVDATAVFLESSALPLICALVVAGFLIWQFGRWLLMNYKITGLETMLGDAEEKRVPAAQMPADGAGRRWATSEKAE